MGHAGWSCVRMGWACRVGWVMQEWGGVRSVIQRWDGVGHVGVGWGGSYRVRWGGSHRDGVGWVM